MTLYSTLLLRAPSYPWAQAELDSLRAKFTSFESGRPRSGRWGAATRRTSPRSTPAKKMTLGQAHQSN